MKEGRGVGGEGEIRPASGEFSAAKEDSLRLRSKTLIELASSR